MGRTRKSPNKINLTPGLVSRFWAKVDKRGPRKWFRTSGRPWGGWSRCWIWTASVDPDGYGRISAGSRGEPMLRTHRVAWVIAFGPIPSGRLVLHACDRPACVNPVHLFLGDDAANAADAARKGRKGRKLDWTQVREIRQARKAGESAEDLAAAFGVSRRTIRHVVARETWKPGRRFYRKVSR